MKTNEILFWLFLILSVIFLVAPRFMNVNTGLVDKLALMFSFLFIVELILSFSKYKKPNLEHLLFLSFAFYIVPNLMKWSFLFQIVLLYFIASRGSKESPNIAIFIAFALIYFIALFPKLSLDYQILVFIASLIIFIMYKIDSRFFILFALYHIILAAIFTGFSNESLAETQAIYSFYYLLVGIFGLMIESKLRPSNILSIDHFLRRIHKEHALLSLLLLFFLFVPNQYIRVASVFLPCSLFFMRFVRYVLKDEKQLH